MRASNRPTFTDIKAYLEGLIEEECGSMYIMLENDYEGMYVLQYRKYQHCSWLSITNNDDMLK